MKIFNKLPLINYWFKDDEEYFFTRNIFIKLKIIDSLKDNPSFLTSYVLNSYERADVVAHKIYGNSNLFWTLYLANDILDPQDWIMDNKTLGQYTKEKYDNEDSTHHIERKGEPADYRSVQILTSKNPFKTIDSSPDNDLTNPNSYTPVSNYQYEERNNDSKHIIRAIRPEYMLVFLQDIEKKLRDVNARN
jgi:Base plate wedge protein 53